MPERRYARYTRKKTWNALYSQAVNACYALVPYSATNNSIWLIRCNTPGEAQSTMMRLLSQSEEIEAFFAGNHASNNKPQCLRNAGEAVILAKSNDYYHYHLAERSTLALVVAGQHNSYLHLPVWETSSNRRYEARETAFKIGSPEFARIRSTQIGHTILIAALASGDQKALSYLATLPDRTRRRICNEVVAFQNQSYRGQPLAFHTESEKLAIGAKISQGLRRYHKNKAS
jgi:hypothetical protein